MSRSLPILLLLMVLILFFAPACRPDMSYLEEPDPEVQEEEEPEAARDPEQVLLDFIRAVKELDLEEAGRHVSSGYMEDFETQFESLARELQAETTEAEGKSEVYRIIFDNFDVEITGHVIEDEKAIVSTRNTYPSLPELNERLIEKMFDMIVNEEIDFENISEEEEVRLILGIISEVVLEVDRITVEADVPMVLEDEQWKVDEGVIFDYKGDLELGPDR